MWWYQFWACLLSHKYLESIRVLLKRVKKSFPFFIWCATSVSEINSIVRWNYLKLICVLGEYSEEYSWWWINCVICVNKCILYFVFYKCTWEWDLFLKRQNKILERWINKFIK